MVGIEYSRAGAEIVIITHCNGRWKTVGTAGLSAWTGWLVWLASEVSEILKFEQYVLLVTWLLYCAQCHLNRLAAGHVGAGFATTTSGSFSNRPENEATNKIAAAIAASAVAIRGTVQMAGESPDDSARFGEAGSVTSDSVLRRT